MKKINCKKCNMKTERETLCNSCIDKIKERIRLANDSFLPNSKEIQRLFRCGKICFLCKEFPFDFDGEHVENCKSFCYNEGYCKHVKPKVMGGKIHAETLFDNILTDL